MRIVSLSTLPETTTSHNAIGKKKNMIPKGVIPSLVQFSQVVFQPGEVAAAHTHDDLYEVFLVEEGSGIITVQKKRYPLQKGVCVVVEPKELHEVANTGLDALRLTYFGIQEQNNL